MFEREETLFVPKSRTMMATWWGVAECLHYVMTHGPATCIFWCPDEDRAVKCIRYCKTLYGQQDERIKDTYPLLKPLEQQAVFKFELKDGGWLMALPGMNPDKIRSEHPTIVMMDEAAFNDHGSEAYANAVSTRPKKLLAVSSANASWFFDFIGSAQPIARIDLPAGVGLSQIPIGKPGAGIKVVRLHYKADPTMTPERTAALKSKYPDESTWNKEMEIDPKARGGQKIFYAFDPSTCLVPRSEWLEYEISDGWLWTIYHACDPHPQTPDAHLWLGAHKDGSLHVFFSWFPNEANERGEVEKISIEKCVENVKLVNKTWDVHPRRRLMDPAGKSFTADENRKVNWFKRYQECGYTFSAAKKNFGWTGYSRMNSAFLPVKTEAGQFPKLKIWDGCGDNAKLVERLEQLRWKQLKGVALLEKAPPEEPEDKDRHLVDCLSMIMLDDPYWSPPRSSGRDGGFIVINEGTGY